MSKAKGARTRRKAIKYLEKQGFLVETVEKTGRYHKYKDAFAGYCIHCWERTDDECCDKEKRFDGFDLIAVNPDSNVYVQVKTNTPATQGPYQAWASMFGNKHSQCWVMTWYDRLGWRIQKYQPNGNIVEVDLRN